MKSAVLKLAIIAIEVAGLLAAAAAGGVAYVLWLLESGPVSLEALAPFCEDAIEHRLEEGHEARVGSLSLVKDRDDGAYNIVLSRLTVEDAAGRRVFDLDRALFNITAGDLFGGRLRPRRVTVDSPSIYLVRRIDRRLAIDVDSASEPSREATPRPSLQSVLENNAFFREVFERADLVNARFSFHDEASGRRWTAHGASGSLQRVGDGYAASVSATFENAATGPAHLFIDAALDRPDGALRVSLDLADAPVADLFDVFLKEAGGSVSGLISGKASVHIDQRGRIMASRLNGAARDGEVRIGARVIPYTALALDAAFDPAMDRFAIDKVSLASDAVDVSLSGETYLNYRQGPDGREALDRIDYQINFSELTLKAPLGMTPDARFGGLSTTGRVETSDRRIFVDAISLSVAGALLKGTADIDLSPAPDGSARSVGAKADLAFSAPLDRSALLAVWPEGLGAGARDFIRDRMTAGRAENIRARLDLAPGAVDAAGGLPDAALSVAFDIRDADVVYAPGMTPLMGASGAAELRGDSFEVRNVSGRIGRIRAQKGGVHITRFRPRGAPAYFRFTADGDAGDVMALINQEPLRLLEATAFRPQMFAGPASVRMEIMRPNMRDAPREAYRFGGEARFDDLVVSDLYLGASLDGAAGVVTFNSDGMTVEAEADLGGAPISLDWRQSFRGDTRASTLTVKGVADSSTGDLFGVATRQYLRGAVAFEATAKSALKGIDRVDVAIDFGEASVVLELLNWMKPAGAPSEGAFAVEFADGSTHVRDIRFEGGGVDIKGAFSLDPAGRIASAAFGTLRFEGVADLSLKAARTPTGALDVAAVGRRLELGPILAAALDRTGREGAPTRTRPADWGAGLILTARLDRLGLRNGVELIDADLDFWRTADAIQRLAFSARAQDGGVVAVDLGPTGADDGPRQTVEARTDDVGMLLSGLFGMRSVQGGQGVIDLSVHRQAFAPGAGESDVEAFGGVSGVVEARGFRIVGAPLLARIFAAGSLPGLSDLLRDEGVEIAHGLAEFGYNKGALHLRDLRAAGPSVGLSAEGRIAGPAAGGVDLSGSVAPLYAVNALLGRAPLVGDLFVSRKGEGVVALAYDVRGEPAALNVTVNPLSALTPGAFRRIFDTERGTIDDMMNGEGDR